MQQLSRVSQFDRTVAQHADAPPKLTYDQVLQKLLILETVGLAKDVDKIGVQAWLSLMNSEGVTLQEWGAAISKVAKIKTYTVKPVEVLEVVKELREEARIQRNREYRASLVSVDMGPFEMPKMVPYYRVLDGRILPEGEVNPDALPPWEAVKSLGAPATTAADRSEKIREIIQRSGPEPARTLITLLRNEGQNVDAEVAVYQDEKKKYEERQAEEKRRTEAEQAESVRRQVASLRREQAASAKHEKDSKANDLESTRK